MVCKTRVIQDSLSPKWNQHFNIVIHKSTLANIANHSDDLIFEVIHNSKVIRKCLGKSKTLALHKFFHLMHQDNLAGFEELERHAMIKEWGTPHFDPYDVLAHFIA